MLHITAIGDSMMLGASDELRASIEHLDIDAKVGRQVGAAIAVLPARRDARQLGDVVVVHVGNNNYLRPERFAELMELLSGVRRVVVVNLKVPRRWEQHNNSLLAEQVARYPNAVLLDWHSASVQHPDLFWRDGMHLRPKGAWLYAELIAERVRGT